MYSYDNIYERTLPVAGPAMTERLRHGLNVLVVGVGGVGSWCAEALVRTGLCHITIVDSDSVAVSNINRQLPATTLTVGRPKVEVLSEHFRAINPEVEVVAVCGRYDETTAGDFDLNSYDYVVDAIDDLAAKALLINKATRSRTRFFSSMGAARKLDPSRIAVAEFYKVQGCALARALRQKFKRTGEFPARKFKCVYSPERLEHRADPAEKGTNGTFMHTTAIFGLTLASLVISDIYSLDLSRK